MKLTNRLYKLILFVGLGSYTLGCGQAFKVGGELPAATIQKLEAIDTVQLKATVENSKLALEKAESALGVIVDPISGNFNWDIFLGGVDFSQVSVETKACLAAAFPNTSVLLRVFTAPRDIAKGLKCILDDVVLVAGIASTDLKIALETLTKAQMQTTIGSPEYLAIQVMIDQILPLQASYSLAMQTLAAQLTVVTTALNQLPTLATAAVPIPLLSLLVGSTVGSFVQPVIFEIMAFQARIQAL